jgi:hypothetical protein
MQGIHRRLWPQAVKVFQHLLRPAVADKVMSNGYFHFYACDASLARLALSSKHGSKPSCPEIPVMSAVFMTVLYLLL